MTTPISERLRNEVNIGSGTVTPLRREAADVIDELCNRAENLLIGIDMGWDLDGMIHETLAAIAKARATCVN